MVVFPRTFPAIHGAFLAAVVGLGPTWGCAVRRSLQRTTVHSSVQVDAGDRSIEPLSRDEYEVKGTAAGKDRTTRVFFLWFPVGNHKSPSEVWDSAYADAVDRADDCDGLLLPRTRVKRIVVPLLLVNVIVKQVEVKGRCIRVKDDAALASGARPRPDRSESGRNATAQRDSGPLRSPYGDGSRSLSDPTAADGDSAGDPGDGGASKRR